jgi:hypothetical protein
MLGEGRQYELIAAHTRHRRRLELHRGDEQEYSLGDTSHELHDQWVQEVQRTLVTARLRMARGR